MAAFLIGQLDPNFKPSASKIADQRRLIGLARSYVVRVHGGPPQTSTRLAVSYVILHGAEFELKLTMGTHRDESGTLRLDGLAPRSKSRARERGTKSR
jgi:hypothetical protein